MKNEKSPSDKTPADGPAREHSPADRSTTDVPSQPPSFELAMKRLSEIVEQLESGELPLEASLRLFEEGVGLSRSAGSLLEAAERKVEALTRAADGSLQTRPFDAGDEDDDDR